MDVSRHASQTNMTDDERSETIDPFTRVEVSKAIKDLNSNRCADAKGVKAEVLKYEGAKLVDVLRAEQHSLPRRLRG